LKGPLLLALLAFAACMAIPLLFSISWVGDAPPGLISITRKILMLFLLGSAWAGFSVWIVSGDSSKSGELTKQPLITSNLPPSNPPAVNDLPLQKSKARSQHEVEPTIARMRPSSNATQEHFDQQPTIYSLYKHDFDSTVRFSGPFSVKEKGTNRTIIEFDAQIYMDIPARTEFIGVYFPHTNAEDTFERCQLFSNYYKGILDMKKPGITSAFVGEEMMSADDLVFSGRVLIYHEDFLSLQQRASLETLYKSKNLSVQFRGPDYLSAKMLTWSESRKP